MPPAVLAPPPTQVEPVTETLHGVEITDPYRWLEDQNSPRTRKWLEEQKAYTRAYLQTIPGRDRIKKRIEELLTVETISEPWKVRNRYFYLKRAASAEQPVLMMRNDDFNEEIVLIDPSLRGKGAKATINIVSVSPDGGRIALGVKYDGADCQAVEFFDVIQRRILPDNLPISSGQEIVFAPNGQSFYYTYRPICSLRPNRAIYLHEFGADFDKDATLFSVDGDSSLPGWVCGSSDGCVLAYIVVTSYDPTTLDVYYWNTRTSNTPRKILEHVESVFQPFFSAHTLLALTDFKSPNLRIVAPDPERPEQDHWRDIIPESPLRIRDCAVAQNAVCVGYVDNLSSHIEVFDVSGQRKDTIRCPSRGTVRLLQRPNESDTLFYSFSSFDQPPTIFAYHAPSRQQRAWAQTAVPFHSVRIQVQRANYKSRDGTTVPVILVRKNRRDSPSPGPVFLTAYGGFGVAVTPQYHPHFIFLIEHGFLIAIANVRGGGEFGEEWHRAGKRQKRKNAIDDFIAAAEWLVENRYTVPKKLAIAGGSNAGLLVGAAFTQRSDLFSAVVSIGPLFDMLRYNLFDSANSLTDEYGTAEKRDDFEHLMTYSPYHRVRDGLRYPAVMIVSGDADTRCNPMHARKMTARLQAASSSKRPVLLEYTRDWGHEPVQPLSRRIDALTDRLAFLCHELGVAP